MRLLRYDIMTWKQWNDSGVLTSVFQLSATTSSDYQLKCGMLNDMLDILDLENKSVVGQSSLWLRAITIDSLLFCRQTGGGDQVGGFDLVYRDGLIRKPTVSQYTSFLGTDIKRTFKPGA